MILGKNGLKILAIGAHPDDIELACGGVISKAVKNDHEVMMVVITGTSSVDHNNIAIRTDTEVLDEQNKACKILGISNIKVLGFDDQWVPYSVDLISKLDTIINEYEPDIIFTHFIFDTHQDHIRAAQSTLSAARKQNTILLYEPINPSGRGYVSFRPQVYIDISETLHLKKEALKAHKSQYEKYGDEWIEAVEARAKYRGFEMGSQYAECFEVVRMEINV